MMDDQHLALVLDRYAPTCTAQLAFKSRMLDLLRGTNAPFAREQLEPGHFTASGFVLSPERSHVLLIHHNKLNRWLQPGGHIEPVDKDIVAAAWREVTEETGVRLRSPDGEATVLDLDIHPIPQNSKESAHQHFDVRFLFQAVDANLQHQAEEVGGARWVGLQDVGALSTDASVLRVVQSLTRPSMSQ